MILKTTDNVPYPPGPDAATQSLRNRDLPAGARIQERLLIAAQLFLIFAGGLMILGLLMGIILSVINAINNESLFDLIAIILGYILFLALGIMVLIKLFRRRVTIPPMLAMEVTAPEQPILFAFLQRICDDVGAGFPRTVLFTPEANAAVVPVARIPSWPNPDLYIGLGLVNALNLSEFQAVLAHELGHCTGGTLANGSRNVSAILRARMPALLQRAVSAALAQLVREREFQADRVAASVAGSNAVASALQKISLGAEAFAQAKADLQRAAEQKHYSADIYYHQHAAKEILLKRGIITMNDEPGEHHPSLSERLANLEAYYEPAEIDERTPWLLFADAAAVRRRMTAMLLRTWPNVPKGATLSDPRQVQKIIDSERVETCFDPKYQQAYDDRDIQLTGESIDELLEQIREEAWSDERLRQVRDELGHDIPGRVARRARVNAQRRRFIERGDTHHAVERLRDFDDRRQKLDAWFHAFDRRVALVHLRMAAALDEPRAEALAERYRAVLAIQESHSIAERHAERVLFYSRFAEGSGPQLLDDFVQALRFARAALKKLVAKNAAWLEDEVIRDLPAGPLSEAWIAKLRRQLERVRDRTARLRAARLAELLHMQDEIAEAYCRRHSQPAEAIAKSDS